MPEKELQDSHDLAVLLKDLTKEDRIRVQGVIAGMRLARSAGTSRRTPRPPHGPEGGPTPASCPAP